MRVQSEMQEGNSPEIELAGVDSTVLRDVVLHMYGKLPAMADEQLLPLFIAADQYQVSCAVQG